MKGRDISLSATCAAHAPFPCGTAREMSWDTGWQRWLSSEDVAGASMSLLISLCTISQQTFFHLLAFRGQHSPQNLRFEHVLHLSGCWVTKGPSATLCHSNTSPALSRGYRKLQAVAEQLIMFETLRQNFENSFISHITNIFELQVGVTLHTAAQHSEELDYPGKLAPVVLGMPPSLILRSHYKEKWFCFRFFALLFLILIQEQWWLFICLLRKIPGENPIP